MLGLSGMMDGQTAYVRAALDAEGFTDTMILAYSAKYAGAFYGPFREAVDSQLSGDRRTYRLDPGNAREGLREALLDVDEGADVVMVKPALDRKSVVYGKSVSVRVYLGGRRLIKKKNMITHLSSTTYLHKH